MRPVATRAANSCGVISLQMPTPQAEHVTDMIHGIFTNMVNIPYMEHMGKVGELLCSLFNVIQYNDL